MSEYEKILESLQKKYMAEGMSEFDARMKAVMSDESQKMVFPGLQGLDKDREDEGWCRAQRLEQIHEYVLCGIYGELDSLEGELSVWGSSPHYQPIKIKA